MPDTKIPPYEECFLAPDQEKVLLAYWLAPDPNLYLFSTDRKNNFLLYRQWKIQVSPIFVCGHKNPDTDSICSAFCYAQLLNKVSGSAIAQPIRCGPLNRQTSYIFKKVGITAPGFVKNLRPKCADVMNPQPDHLNKYAPLNTVFHLLDEKDAHAVPVVNNEAQFLGLVNINILTKRFLGFGHGRTEIVFNAQNVSELLESQPLRSKPAADASYSLVIGAFPFDDFVKRLTTLNLDRVLLVVGERPDIIEHAIAQKVAIIVITGIQDPLHISLPVKEIDSWIFTSKFDTIETYRRLMLSMPVESVMSSDTPSLTPDSALSEAAAILADHAVRGIPIINDNKFAGLITRTDLLAPKKQKLILMDHNELAQAIDGAEFAEIVEIIDHHRIGNLTTSTPIAVYAKPVGCTCTLVFEKFCMKGIVPEPTEAMLMMSGIISDTLALRSPTTTNDDCLAIEELARIAQVPDWKAFANDIFTNSSNLLFENLRTIVSADLKMYTANGISVGISQIEIVDMDEVAEVKQKLSNEVDLIRQTKSLDWVLLLVTDIIHGNSVLITSGFPKGDAALRYTIIDKGYFSLPGVLSRKKQLLPEVLRVLDDVSTPQKKF